MKLSQAVFTLAALATLTGCSQAVYQIAKKGTWQIGVSEDNQPTKPVYLQNVKANAPGGETAVVMIFFGANKAPTTGIMVKTPIIAPNAHSIRIINVRRVKSIFSIITLRF